MVRKILDALSGSLLLAGLLCLTQSQSFAQAFSTLHTFTGLADGASPAGGLVADGQGNFYGVAEGTNETFGSVFEISPATGGGWTLTTLYTFKSLADGYYPVARLVLDRNGNLWGTTVFGGTGCQKGCGTVFRLVRNGSGVWQKQTIHQFQNRFDGASPLGPLIFDKDGNVFGTTSSGGGTCAEFGAQGCGTIFELAFNGAGYTESIVHSFNRLNEMNTPQAGLTLDRFGNLYGTASFGGQFGCGGVFEFSPSANGWTGRPLHYFDCDNDGAYPYSTLVLGQHGWLYGTTLAGGTSGIGTVFLLRLGSGGSWSNIVIHNFNDSDGSGPATGLAIDASGNFYGTTTGGGDDVDCDGGCGVAFKITPRQPNFYDFSLLHVFNGADGRFPSPLTLDSAGNIFGETGQGDVNNFGNLFEITQ